MNVRIKFSKYGMAKFIGHLDVVRYFQRAIRRSGLEAAYSEGFNPHQLLYFAAPLGLGETSDGEYMDAEFLLEYPVEEIKERLNAVMAEGFFIHTVTKLAEWKPNTKKESVMSLASCADYMVSVKDVEVEHSGIVKPYAEWLFKMQEGIKAFLDSDKILVEKNAKKGKREIDAKPMIFAWGFAPEDIEGECSGISHAEQYKNGIRLFLRLASGSVENLKPELLMEAYCAKNHIPYKESAPQFNRMEIYCDLSLRNMNHEEAREAISEGKRRREFVPLYRVGEHETEA